LSRPGLPEHPERVMLKQQIRLLLERLQVPRDREEVKNDGKDDGEQKILDYVMDRGTSPRPGTSSSLRNSVSRKGSRPLTASSRPGTARTINSAPEMLQHMKHHLTVSKIDKIIRDLKITFEEEESELMGEISELKGLIEEEMQSYSETKVGKMDNSPSIMELKSYNKKLQEKWLTEDHAQQLEEKTGRLSSFPRPPPPLVDGSPVRPGFTGVRPPLPTTIGNANKSSGSSRGGAALKPPLSSSSHFSSRLRTSLTFSHQQGDQIFDEQPVVGEEERLDSTTEDRCSPNLMANQQPIVALSALSIMDGHGSKRTAVGCGDEELYL